MIKNVKMANIYLDLLIRIAACFATLIISLNYFTGLSLFQNKSEIFRSDFAANAAPMVHYSYELMFKHQSYIKQAQLEAVSIIALEALDDHQKISRINIAVDTLENIIKCRRSYFCQLDDYAYYEKSIVQFWFMLKPALLHIRKAGHLDFATELEKEAIRIKSRI